MDAAESTQEVAVRFTTPIAALRVPAAPVAVPAELNRNGLSQVIHHLLGIEGSSAFRCARARAAAACTAAGAHLLRPASWRFKRCATPPRSC